MPLEEKIDQMTLVEEDNVATVSITGLVIGALLTCVGAYPEGNSPEGWLDMLPVSKYIP